MKENIEEDIKRISNLIDYVENADYVDVSQCFDSEDIQAIEHILSDYKRVLKENEELKEEYKNAQACANMVFDKVIPVQKVKDKIEELNKKEQELQNSISDEEREEYSDASISFDLMDIHIRREELQEFLEEKGE